MKQTAVEKMIQYFIKQKNNGASHWCIDDLIAQLHQAKEMEKEQIMDAYNTSFMLRDKPYSTADKYYNETFKSE
jgi:L-arabinose isomerase